MLFHYIRAVSKKWYVEFLVVLVIIIAAIVFALNINFSSQKAGSQVTKVADKPSPEKERWLRGRDIFKANCVACHNVKYDGVGPPLKGAAGRWKAAGSYQGKTGEQWMKTWVRNWHDVVDAGYKYGIDLKNSRPAQMNIFPALSDDDIDKIMFYVESPDLGKPAK